MRRGDRQSIRRNVAADFDKVIGCLSNSLMTILVPSSVAAVAAVAADVPALFFLRILLIFAASVALMFGDSTVQELSSENLFRRISFTAGITFVSDSNGSSCSNSGCRGPGASTAAAAAAAAAATTTASAAATTTTTTTITYMSVSRVWNSNRPSSIIAYLWNYNLNHFICHSQ